MRDYKWLHEYCLNRFGSAAELDAHLPVPKTPAQLRKISDDRYLSTLALRVFRAGLEAQRSGCQVAGVRAGVFRF